MEELTTLLPEAGAEAPQPMAPAYFTDRELSWLQFDLRVLLEAGDPAVPLLERLKYLSIYQKNLDEFFMVRIGFLVHRGIFMPMFRDPKTGWDTPTQLNMIAREVRRQQTLLQAVYDQLLTDLCDAGIELLDFRRISKADESIARKFFAEARQLLSPRIVDAAHPMPFLDNRETYIAALLKKGDKWNLGLVYLSRLPAFYVFESDGKQKMAMTDQLVRHFAPLLFKKYDLRDSCSLRVTRNADIFLLENTPAEDEDLRVSMEKLLKKRKRQQIVRLELGGKPDRRLRERLEKYLKVEPERVYQSTVPFRTDFADRLRAAPELRYPEQHSLRSIGLRKGEYFRYLDRQDLLLSFPYQSMNPFVEMLYEAADDPEVMSIRIALYRLAPSSKLAAALAYAADQGKEVLCLLELRARFDEKNNIDYSEVLEEAGCSVIYGLPEQKVHAKLCLITRQCGNRIKYITQIGTGNYNEITGEQYCDLSLITGDEKIGADTAAIFEALALGQVPERTEAVITSPKGFRPMLLEALDGEKSKGADGFVAIKVNGMNDLEVMQKLIDCAQAGVTVELFIRGICCLLPACSENLRVRSVVGRYLEHSRIYVFGRGESARVYMGSGDLLNRNTQRRVEAFVELTAPETRQQVLEIMEAFRQDDVKGWEMADDGSYHKVAAPRGEDSQERLYRYFTAEERRVRPPAAPAQRKSIFAWLRKKK